MWRARWCANWYHLRGAAARETTRAGACRGGLADRAARRQGTYETPTACVSAAMELTYSWKATHVILPTCGRRTRARGRREVRQGRAGRGTRMRGVDEEADGRVRDLPRCA